MFKCFRIKNVFVWLVIFKSLMSWNENDKWNYKHLFVWNEFFFFHFLKWKFEMTNRNVWINVISSHLLSVLLLFHPVPSLLGRLRCCFKASFLYRLGASTVSHSMDLQSWVLFLLRNCLWHFLFFFPLLTYN